MSILKINSADKEANSLTNEMASGKIWKAKNILTSNMRKLLNALSEEIVRIKLKINEVYNEMDVRQTDRLIVEWEKQYGIPDDCFKIEDTLQKRIDNILLKIQSNGASIEEDFLLLANTLNINIDIQTGFEATGWPWTWPHVWVGTEIEARNTMVVTFLDLVPPTGWPWTWPHAWIKDETVILRCLFNKLKPANIKIQYIYGG
jgi:uncharacterized protein YmfQ (DUF2313 family)